MGLWQYIPNDLLRSGREVEKISTFVPVVAAALIDGKGRVLMQQRRLDGAHGGLWEFPGGKIEPDESADGALVREIAEEIGCSIEPCDLAPVGFASHPGVPHVILLYLCRKWVGEPRCLDGEAIAWYALEALRDLDMPPLDYPLAEALRRAI
ncbi:MAG: (deoxy)nucleoside triphosphate pyrophosphohydrolase [Burkholderiales bacterium]